MPAALPPPPPSLADPELALRWLTRARRGALAIQLLLMLVAEAGTDIHVHSPELLTILSGLILVDVGQAVWVRRHGQPPWLALAHGAVDLCALTGILLLSGGIQNPLMAAYLVYLALLALVLPARGAWTVAIGAMVLQAIAVLNPGHVDGLVPEALTPVHVVGHVLTFDLAAIAVTWVVNQLSTTLRERDTREREAQRRRAVTERLAALGTLAAGVAHELGTPLGTIQLLAEEAGEAPSPEQMAALLTEVARCRSILDRLRGADGGGAADCVPDVDGWVLEWARAAPEVAVRREGGVAGGRIAGSEASWRGAVWVMLDNARRAGAREVVVETHDGEGWIELYISDDGRGLSAEEAARSGEPFRTGWGGTGLGLFVARSFAQSVGGEVALAPGPAGGARVTVQMPRVPPC